jgi:hypothetical protein
MGLGVAVFLTAMFPIGSLLDVVFHNSPAGSSVAKMIVFLPAALWLVCTQCQMTALPFPYAMVGVIASWAVCACGVYLAATRGDLVSIKRDTADLSATEIRDIISQLRGRERT